MKKVDDLNIKYVSGAGSNNGNNGGGHGSNHSSSGSSSGGSSGNTGGNAGNHSYLGSNRGSGSQAYHFGHSGYDGAIHGGCVGGARHTGGGGKNH